MSDINNLRKPGVAQRTPVLNEHNKVIFEDKHYVIEILLATYFHEGYQYVVAGYNCIVGSEPKRLNPTPENGLYCSERAAVVSMLQHIGNNIASQWPEEIKEILKLAIYQERQTSIFN